MKACRRLPTFHFELLFSYLFSFVETSTDGVDRTVSPHAFMEVRLDALQNLSGPKVFRVWAVCYLTPA
jgi:hypothetical protein